MGMVANTALKLVGIVYCDLRFSGFRLLFLILPLAGFLDSLYLSSICLVFFLRVSSDS